MMSGLEINAYYRGVLTTNTKILKRCQQPLLLCMRQKKGARPPRDGADEDPLAKFLGLKRGSCNFPSSVLNESLCNLPPQGAPKSSRCSFLVLPGPQLLFQFLAFGSVVCSLSVHFPRFVLSRRFVLLVLTEFSRKSSCRAGKNLQLSPLRGESFSPRGGALCPHGDGASLHVND